MNRRAVGYCRFSSDSQREESIDAQLRAIRDFCKQNNYDLIKVYKDEGISGTSTKDRESFLQLIEDSKKNMFDYVIVHKFDRFARNRYDHAIYEKILNDNKVKLLSVLERLNDSPESVILKSVLTGMNEYYSLNLSREIKKGLNENALKAMHTCGIPPLGYDLDENRRYIINEKEAEAVRLIFSLAADGVGFASIARTLNERSYKNKRGREFKKTSIRDTLLNQKYIGTYFHSLKNRDGTFRRDPILIENAHPAIIEKSLFYKVQTRFKNHLKGPRDRKNTTYYLTGFCRCGECGGSYSGGYRSAHIDGSIHYGYECRKRRAKENNCKNKPVLKEVLEPVILELIKSEIFTEENMEILVKDISEVIKKYKMSQEQEEEYYVKEIEKLNKMLLKLLDKNLEGFLSDEIFRKKNKELNERILIMKEKLYSFETLDQVKEDNLRKYLLKLKNDSTHSLNRKIVESFLYEVIIYKNHIEVTLRRFPKQILDMSKDGGSRGNRTHKTLPPTAFQAAALPLGDTSELICSLLYYILLGKSISIL